MSKTVTVTFDSVQAFCALINVRYIPNDLVPSDPDGNIYQQTVKLTFQVLDANGAPMVRYATDGSTLPNPFTETITWAATQAPLGIDAISAGFKGAWTDLMIAKTAEIVTREVGAA